MTARYGPARSQSRRAPGSPYHLLRALVLLVTAVASSASAQLTAGQAPPDFQLTDVRQGMTGYGLTAGPGDVIERFPVEVVGVQHAAGPGFDLVLVRVSGPFIEASGGVAAGMSGSPVYLFGGPEPALLGAIGYVFPNADHTLALVTPIAAMRADAARAEARHDDAHAAASGAATALEAWRPTIPGIGDAVPVATPVLVTGATSRSHEFLGPLFRDASVVPFPVQAGGASPEASEPFALVPGAAVAVRLMGGAVELSAVGTVTTVDDGRLLAFGHPFLGLGPASYALAPAHVTTIVASQVVPFKLANTGAELLGAIEMDAPAAIAGTVGATPDTVPLTVAVDTGTRHEVFDLTLAADERLYPGLTAIATLQLVDEMLRMTGAGHADLAWTIEFEGGERLNMLEQVNSDSDIALESARLAGGPLAILATNTFKEPAVTAIDLSVSVMTEQNYATVESLVLEEDTVAAGEHAIVHVRLQPFRRQAIVRTFSVQIPATSSGSVTLLVRGGDVPRDIDDVPEEGGEVDEPRSFPELLEALRGQLQASELVIESIDEDGDIRRLSRTSLPFVVLDSQEVTVTVTGAAGAEQEAERQDQESDPGTAPGDEEQEDE